MNNIFDKSRRIPATCHTCGVLSAFLVICASHVVGAQRIAGADVDIAILPAILEFAALDARPVDLRVDPRPLAAGAAYQYEIEPQALARVSAGVISRRADVLRAAAMRIADTAMVNQSRNCAGALVITPADSLGRGESKRVVGCPEDPFDVISVGSPRRGSAILPDDSVYDRDSEAAARGYWAVRVIRTTLGHERSSAYAAD
jgi:hypothetical protein